MAAESPAAPARGSIGTATYERVRALLAEPGGMTTRQAVERVADETGRSVGAVQAAYYTAARSDPNSTVKRRPRTSTAKTAPAKAMRARAPRRSAPSPSRGAELVANFVAAERALLAYIEELEADRRRLEAIRKALPS